MKFACVVLSAALCAAPSVFAQKLDLKFDALAAKASDKAEIDLDSNLLRMFLRMSGETDQDGLLSGIRALRVRSYSFDQANAYSQKDLDALHAQVNAQSRWVRVVNHKDEESTSEIWVAADGDKLGACLIISAEAKELSVVYLEGTLSLAKVKGFMEHDGPHGLLRLAGR